MCEHKECNGAKERTKRVKENILKGIVEEQDRQPLHRLVSQAIEVLNSMPGQVWESLANGEARMLAAGGGSDLGSVLASILSGDHEQPDPEDKMLNDGIPTTWPSKGSQKGN